jgi:glucoamylase
MSTSGTSDGELSDAPPFLCAGNKPLKSKPHLIDAIVGNGKFLGALSEDGELYRLWWPHIGFPNHIYEFMLGVFVEDLSFDISWLNSSQWSHNQFYLPDTNVLVTKSTNKALPIALEVSDFCPPNGDTLVRSLDITSLTGSQLTVRVYVSASFSVGESTRYNAVEFNHKNDALLYWRHEFAFAVGSSRECTGFEAGRTRDSLTTKNVDTTTAEQALHGGHECNSSHGIVLNGNDIKVGMNGALSWTIVTCSEAAEIVNLPIFISAGNCIESALAELQVLNMCSLRMPKYQNRR